MDIRTCMPLVALVALCGCAQLSRKDGLGIGDGNELFGEYAGYVDGSIRQKGGSPLDLCIAVRSILDTPDGMTEPHAATLTLERVDDERLRLRYAIGDVVGAADVAYAMVDGELQTERLCSVKCRYVVFWGIGSGKMGFSVPEKDRIMIRSDTQGIGFFIILPFVGAGPKESYITYMRKRSATAVP